MPVNLAYAHLPQGLMVITNRGNCTADLYTLVAGPKNAFMHVCGI
uniref:Uncharacterized protein n=1 Tax=Anguilla anguilla TaxID=7936 RepID=A0A0E9W6R8_ANGAN